jgi:hypothetical protein
MQPHTRYAESGGLSIAYQVLGEGPRDVVFVPGWVSNIEVYWEEPTMARFLTRLGSFSRLILFDKRGTGLSDRVTDMPGLEVRMDDVRAVIDAAHSEQAVLFGTSEGGPMSALFTRLIVPAPRRSSCTAAIHGERGRQTILSGQLNKNIGRGSARCNANGADRSDSASARRALRPTNDSRNGGPGC